MVKFLAGLIIVIAAIASLMLIPAKQPPAPMPWEVTIEPDGKPKVFNIHLGTTTYRQAQQSFHQYGKTAAFTEDNKPSTVEAYFNSLHLGGLDAKLVLNLAVNEELITQMLSRADEARIQPSGARRYELSSEDNARVVDSAITAITYIPSVRLKQDMAIHRFGEASNIEKINETGAEIWHYPAIGLTIRFKEGEKAVLQYQMTITTMH